MNVTAKSPASCLFCGAQYAVRSGLRKTRTGIKQVFRCKTYFRRFSGDSPTACRTPPHVIRRALTRVCQDYTYDEALRSIAAHLRIRVSKSAISKWVTDFTPRISAQTLDRAGRRAVSGVRDVRPYRHAETRSRITPGNANRDTPRKHAMTRLTEGNALPPNKLCGYYTSAMSRPWTRASNMANGLLKKLGLAAAITGSALLGAREAKAASVPWGVDTPASDILLFADPIYGYPVESYSVGSVNLVNDYNGQLLPNNFAFGLICTAVFDGGYEADLGLINRNNSGSSSAEYVPVIAAESFFGSGNDRYLGVIDYDGDGDLGDYDPVTGEFAMDPGDRLIGNVTVGFNSGVLTVDGHYYAVPEASTGVLTALGLSALALPSGTNVIHFRIAMTNLSSFRLECRDSLTNAAWTSLGQYSVTGAVTEVSDTNTAPARFYRAVSP